MDAWGWILTYAVGLVILQVLVYRYLWRRSGPIGSDEAGRWRAGGRDRRDVGGDVGSPGDVHDVGNRGGANGERDGDGSDDRSREDAGETSVWSDAPIPAEPPSRVDREADADESGARQCPHCGAENEPDRTFDRCWNCAQRLT